MTSHESINYMPGKYASAEEMRRRDVSITISLELRPKNEIAARTVI